MSTPTTPATTPATTPTSGPLVRAARGERPAHTPVWFMRQAGRSLPEYRRARGDVPMLEACRRPDLVAEITLQPVRRYGVDAAIFYSDIVVPLKAVGVDVEIVPGTGPVVARPFASWEDLDRIPPLTAEHVTEISEAVRILVAELGEVPLIGFAGAPFTLASYLVEGGPSRDLRRTKALMLGRPDLWRALTERLAQISGEFLRVQVEAGASAVQLFDSWVGNVSLADYVRHVRPASARALAAVRSERDGVRLPPVPRIHFGVGTGELLSAMAGAGAEVVGVDFRVPLDVAAARLGSDVCVQGNLDPAVLFAPWPVVEQRVRDTLARGRAARGHIFNLGHGVPPETDPDVLARIVDLVHELGPAQLEEPEGPDDAPTGS